MKKRLLIAVLFGAISIALQSAMAMAAPQEVYVLSQDDGILSLIDTNVDEIAAKIAITGKPADFVVSEASRKAFATLPDAGAVAVVDLDRRVVLPPLKIGGQPFGIAADNAGQLFIGDWSANRISIVNEKTGVVVETLSVGRAPAHLVANRAGSRLYIADRESNSVAVVDPKKLTILTEIPVGRAPFALALSPDEKQLAVANVQTATLSIIDTKSLQVVSSPTTRPMPYGVTITHDNSEILVSNQHGGSISIFNAQTHVPRVEI